MSPVALFTRAWIEIAMKFLLKQTILVALFTRAWIEIYCWLTSKVTIGCRPLYEGVDWNGLSVLSHTTASSRPLYEGVDWNRYTRKSVAKLFCRPLYEGVDWNRYELQLIFYYPVALFTRAWIEITVSYKVKNETESPSLRGRGLKYYNLWLLKLL